MLPMIPLSLALLSAVIACATDAHARRIPNWLTLPLLLVGLLFWSFADGLSGLLAASTGMLACFAPSYFLFSRGALGGGDVKLFAGLGALVGAHDGLELQLTAFVLVSVFVVLTMACRGHLRPLLRASYQATFHLLLPSRFARPSPSQAVSTEIPMGAAILVATIALCLRSAS